MQILELEIEALLTICNISYNPKMRHFTELFLQKNLYFIK